MKKALIVTSVIFFLVSCQRVQQNLETIKVSGEGKIRVKPNLIIMTIEVSFVQPRMADAVRQSQQTVDSVVTILSHFGGQNDIKTSSIAANKSITLKEDEQRSLDIKLTKVLTLF